MPHPVLPDFSVDFNLQEEIAQNGVLNKTLHYLDEDRAMTIPDWQKQLYESIERGNAGGEKH